MVQSVAYGPWGETLEGLGSTIGWPFLYQGKEYINGLGYDFHTRSYDPHTGRFMQVDGANQFASGYTDMGNMPTMGVDPDGQIVFIPLVVAGAALMGGSLNLYSNWGKVKNWKQGLAYFASGAVGGAVATVNPVLGGSITATSNVGIDIATGNMPKLDNAWQVAKYTGGIILDGFSVGGAGSLANVIIPKLAANYGFTVTSSVVFTNVGKYTAGEIVMKTTGEVVVTASKNGAKRFLIGQGGKQALGVVDEVATSGLQASENVIKSISSHATNQAITRGFNSADILKIVKEGTPLEALGRYGSQIRYTLGNNTVVVNAQGKVITLFSKVSGSAKGFGKGFFAPF